MGCVYTDVLQCLCRAGGLSIITLQAAGGLPCLQLLAAWPTS